MRTQWFLKTREGKGREREGERKGKGKEEGGKERPSLVRENTN